MKMLQFYLSSILMLKLTSSETSGISGGIQNVALNKMAYQSENTYVTENEENLEPKLGVDGDPLTASIVGDQDISPWWVVDLARSYHIVSVNVTFESFSKDTKHITKFLLGKEFVPKSPNFEYFSNFWISGKSKSVRFPQVGYYLGKWFSLEYQGEEMYRYFAVSSGKGVIIDVFEVCIYSYQGSEEEEDTALLRRKVLLVMLSVFLINVVVLAVILAALLLRQCYRKILEEVEELEEGEEVEEVEEMEIINPNDNSTRQTRAQSVYRIIEFTKNENETLNDPEFSVQEEDETMTNLRNTDRTTPDIKGIASNYWLDINEEASDMMPDLNESILENISSNKEQIPAITQASYLKKHAVKSKTQLSKSGYRDAGVDIAKMKSRESKDKKKKKMKYLKTSKKKGGLPVETKKPIRKNKSKNNNNENNNKTDNNKNDENTERNGNRRMNVC